LLDLLSIQNLSQLRIDLSLQCGQLLALILRELQLVLHKPRHDFAWSRWPAVTASAMTASAWSSTFRAAALIVHCRD
jgi:hypothetical protein